MPIPLTNLDDHSYDDLVKEAQALIPLLSTQWTNFNPSEPGIVFVELLAWLTEMIIYRTNQVAPKNIVTFLSLLGRNEITLSQGITRVSKESLEDAIQQTLSALYERYRAITADDFEYLALYKWSSSAEGQEYRQKSSADVAIRRVRCIPQCKLEPPNLPVHAAPHVTLIILPDTHYPFTPDLELLNSLNKFLDARRLLTIKLHVMGPLYLNVIINGTIVVRGNASAASVLLEARSRLASYFDPISGGTDNQGWPFGRNVYVSDIYAQLMSLAWVDYITDVSVQRGDQTTPPDLISVQLAAYQLVEIDLNGLVAIDTLGIKYTFNPNTQQVIQVSQNAK